ncbi:CapA family protein [Bellilinea sp.]|uniref:CapA family protein n=1 Tax=Bellilinea sp. TaxID=2838785 RepID=UPI002ADDAEEA|nr:CapA family protein [Bellilinea sp.]
MSEKLSLSAATATFESDSPVYLKSDPLPAAVQTKLNNLENVEWVDRDELADYSLKINHSNETAGSVYIQWVYAVTAAFPTVQDEIGLDQIKECWQGASKADFRLLISEEAMPIFRVLWGEADRENVEVFPAEMLLQKAWQERDLRAIIPFEQIEPRWKVLRVDGISPLDQGFEMDAYGLTIRWEWQSNSQKPFDVMIGSQAVITNRLPGKFTRLILTGTTALVRQTAERMELNGLEYPVEDIGVMLRQADFTHISNEVSFYENCPPAVPVRGGQRFCANPRYIEFLKLAGADFIELTGNHLLDWGNEPFLFTLDLYKQNGFQYYGGGRNLEEARKPLRIEHNGNRLALIGCNRAGPENIWASEEQAGPAPCDFEWLQDTIQNLVEEGFLPIVTFQHFEVEDFMPMNLTLQEFEQTAQMGAVIVSGSQAHFAHGFGFYENRFMHYGLGNLFFDQMFPLHRRQFIDRHLFYDGKYLGVELITTLLEDYAKPRLMTEEERAQMLEEYFRVSGWMNSEMP